MLVDQRRLHEATSQFHQALALRPELPDAHYNLGRVLAIQNKLDQAAARLLQALALRPNHPGAHNSLGNVRRKQGRLDEAAACLRQALALQPDLAEAHYNLGLVLEQQGHLDQAAAHYEQALALRPEHAGAHDSLGSLLARQGQLDQAAARFQQALACGRILPRAQQPGQRLLEPRAFRSSCGTVRASDRTQPNLADAHHNLGLVLRHRDQLEQARTQFARALNLRPDYPEAQLGLATCHLAAGDYERGWAAFEGRLRLRLTCTAATCRAGMAKPWWAAGCYWWLRRALAIRCSSCALPGC